MKMPKLDSVTAVLIARHALFERELLDQMIAALREQFVDVETVIVANGISPELSIELKTEAESIPDCTVLFLSDEVHDDVARLLGIDHAIADYVLFTTPLPAQVNALPAMVDALRQSNDVVIGKSVGGVMSDRSGLAGALFDLFRAAHRLLTGVSYEAQSPAFRIFSRAAALYIATRRDGEVLVRARSLGQGFAATTIVVDDMKRITMPSMPLRLAVAKALRLMLTGSARPLRLTSYLGFGGGVLAVLYGVYAILTYLLKADVAPGWTTLSLLLAAMLFVFSSQFLFLSEYLVQILSTVPSSSRRQLVAREFRSPLTGRGGRLNVVDGEDEFQLGAPKTSARVERP